MPPLSVYGSRNNKVSTKRLVLLAALLATLPAIYLTSWVVGRAFIEGALSTEKVVVLVYEEPTQ